ncbi:unnamed protein product [Lampetra planeri]
MSAITLARRGEPPFGVSSDDTGGGAADLVSPSRCEGNSAADVRKAVRALALSTRCREAAAAAAAANSSSQGGYR